MPKNLSNQSIFLIGFMGAGKSDVGLRLSIALNKPFYDSDQVIVDSTGHSIANLFQIHGEIWFRKTESDVLKSLTKQSNRVVATGGGVILDSNNRTHLRASGYVIYLRAQIDTLWARVKNSTIRPLLQVEQPYETLKALFNLRASLYEETAHVIIDTDHLTLDDVCTQCVSTITFN